MGPSKNLSKREKNFCRFYVYGDDPYDAAKKAGYTITYSKHVATRIMDRPQIRAEIQRLRGELLGECEVTALAALRRLALSPVNDAVALALCDDPTPVDAAPLDLFAVSDFKRTKGGCEIRFHDRIKAATLLLEHGRAAKTGDSETRGSLLEAFAKGAAAVADFTGDDPDAV